MFIEKVDKPDRGIGGSRKSSEESMRKFRCRWNVVLFV